MTPETFRTRLLEWYTHHRRDLPWRHTQDPYPIWLSEIILQQTRVAQGMPYWQRFMETFPTVQDLAAAEEQEVLRLWQGLGYYSRARNLHACARQIVEERNGEWPTTYEELQTLKGVGKYTAAAIASFAFGQAAPVVDGNVYRLYARVFGVDTDIANSKAFGEFFALGQTLIDPKLPGDYNQASMEFGSTYCKPQNPPCLTCIFADGCEAYATGRQAQLPVKTKKTKVRHRYFDYLVFRHGDQWLVKTRPEGDIWAGLHDFYLVESPSAASPEEWPKEVQPLVKEYPLEGGDTEFQHVLSHQRLHTRFYEVPVKEKEAFLVLATKLNLKAVSDAELEDLPKPILIVKFLSQ